MYTIQNKQHNLESQNGIYIYIEHKGQSSMNDLNAKFTFESTISI